MRVRVYVYGYVWSRKICSIRLSGCSILASKKKPFFSHVQAACDVAFAYAHERKQFGQRIGEFQLLQGKMADMYTTLNACRTYLYSVGRAVDQVSQDSVCLTQGAWRLWNVRCPLFGQNLAIFFNEYYPFLFHYLVKNTV